MNKSMLAVIIVLVSLLFVIGCTKVNTSTSSGVNQVGNQTTNQSSQNQTIIIGSGGNSSQNIINQTNIINNQTTTTITTNNQTSSGNSPQTYTVMMKNFAFNPDNLKIKIGDTVKWINGDSASHNIKSTDGSGEINSPSVPQGGSYSHTFNNEGTFDYFCSIHPSMTGSIEVNQ